jgi:hypothetical protein
MAYPDQGFRRPATEQPYGNAQYGDARYGDARYGNAQHGEPQYGEPQYGNGQPAGPAFGGPAPEPDSGPNLTVGLALLLCSALCLGMLFFNPARLLALAMVLPIGAALLYVWFRDRARTNAGLTVGALALLSITVGLGVAMIVTDHRASVPTPNAPLTPISAEPTLDEQAPAPSQPAPSTPAPSTSPAPPSTSSAPAPAPTAVKHPASTASKPATRDHRTPPVTHSPVPSRTGVDTDSDEARRGSHHDRSDRSDRDRESAPDTDRDSDRDSMIPNEQPREPKNCDLGAVRLNPDGTADVCADSNGEGGYTWRRNQRIPD